MPVPDLSPQEVQFAEVLAASPEVRAVHDHDHARTRGGGKLLDVYEAGELVVMQDPEGEWFAKLIERGLDINWALDTIYEAFYDHYEDDYEYITFVMVRDFGVFAAFYQPMANDTLGIGYDSVTPGELFDTTSDTKIEGMIFMNYYGLWTEDREVSRYVFGQEFMHRWGSFVNVELPEAGDDDALLGRDTAHWSYWLSTPNSPMEGNLWVDNGDGTYTIDSSASTYSTLDLYLMGLAPAEEVGQQTLLLVDDLEQARVGRDSTYTPEFLGDLQGDSKADITVTGTPVNFGLDAITVVEGERAPAYADSPKEFRMAIVVLGLADDEITDEVLAQIDGLRTTWEADWEADVLNRGDLITTLGNGTAEAWGATGDSGDTGGADSGEPAPADTGPVADTAGGDTSGAPVALPTYLGGGGCAHTPAPAALGLFAAAAAWLGARRRVS